VKLKILQRNKTKEGIHIKDDRTREKIRDNEEIQNKTITPGGVKKTPTKEYNETLYSEEFAQKQQKNSPVQQKPPTRRTTWENAETIEQNIDRMRLQQSNTTSDHSPVEIDTDKKVDFILLKKKNRS
jgi:hypothetical protein